MMILSNAPVHSTQETAMTKKSKKRIRGKAPATLKDVAPVATATPVAVQKVAKPQSKVSVVTEMVSKGCTLDEIQQRLSIGKIAAASLIGDCRKRGAMIKSEKSPAGVVVYRAV
jgi:hypothetical protein